jgi:protein ImuB
VLSSARIEDAQTDLAGDTIDAGEDLALFADRIRARLGDNALLVPVMVESHIPERATIAATFGEKPWGAGPGTTKPTPQSRNSPERPVRLFRDPEPVEVTAELPEGPPARFHWRRALHRVAAAEGPERIAPEWWRDKADAPTRDYFRVEDEAGRRYWLFREGFYGGAKTFPRWFMHGIFA